MKRALSTILGVILLVPSMVSAAEGNGSVGNGGDNHPADNGTAWFLGDRTIRICYEVSPTFTSSNVDYRANIDSALHVWDDYLAVLNGQLSIQLPLTAQHVYLDKCDGTQDLAIYFGVTNALVEAAKSNYVNPTGFARRSEYNASKGWGKGFIWIAAENSVSPKFNFPNWTLPHNLHGMLLHEFGHVLGCDHVDGTIMQENISDLLSAETDSETRRMRLTNIDGNKFLVPAGNRIFRGTGVSADTFEIMTGRRHVGEITISLDASNNFREVTVVIGDQAGTTRIPVLFSALNDINIGTGVLISTRIFAIARMDENNHWQTMSLGCPAFVFYVNVTTASGELVPALFQVNMGTSNSDRRGPINVMYLHKNDWVDLFNMTIQ